MVIREQCTFNVHGGPPAKIYSIYSSNILLNSCVMETDIRRKGRKFSRK